MHRVAATLALLFAMVWPGSALAARDPRVLKAIDFFDRAEFTRAKDLLVTLVDAPALSEEDLLQSRIYLAASYYGLGDRASARAQFLVLVRRFPRAELDPGLFLPEVVDLFKQARMEVLKERPAQPGSDKPVAGRGTSMGPPGSSSVPPAKAGAAPGSGSKGFSAMTFVPFGAGQFSRGDATLGHVFLWSEVGTLALAAGAKIHFQYLKVSPSRPWDFSQPAYVADAGYANLVQNVFAGSLIAAGVIAAAGIAEASLHGSGALALMVRPAPSGFEVRF
ncbi:MAG TPA: hypothetical protein VIG99_00125 [Myxococcaceae bacterium]|jgi:hypothetical protein